ncbi:MAG: hypothetical protein WCO79_03160 [bacterium]
MKDRLLFHDFLVLAASIILAVVLVQTGILSQLLVSTGHGQFVGSFVAGLFFTSIFTTAPAIVALGQIASMNTIILTAFFGAIGATLGDIVIFRFVRDRFSEHLTEVILHNSTAKRVSTIFRRRSFRWFTFFVGGVIIASPLPDELGIGLLGMSHLKMRRFVPLSFVCNFIGIVLIGLAARVI